MPAVRILGGDIPLRHDMGLIDTNALVAYFDLDDALHEAARITLEDDRRYEWLLTGPVLVEASGLLMSRAGRRAVAEMHTWVATPGTGISILTCSEGPNEHEQNWMGHTTLCDKRQLDFVDVYLMRVATILRTCLGFHAPVVPILTADSDFYRGSGTGFKYGVLDYRELAGDVVEIK